MSLKEFRELDAKQLKEREAELRQGIFKLREQAATEKVKDTSQFRKLRQDLARVMTLQRQRELAEQKKS